MKTPELSSHIRSVMETLAADPAMQKALRFLEDDAARTLEELKEMVLVPGPTFEEQQTRSPMYKAKLELYGAENCTQDAIGNVAGYVNGTAPRPKVMFDAHLDTVFSMDEPLAVTEKDGVLKCPGISDDTAGLAMNLSILRAIRHAGLKPRGRLMLTGTVRHEGEGDLQGMKTLFAEDREIDACLCSETLGKPGAIIATAIGVNRYEIIFKGPGGHSWLDFGRPSPIQALCRAGAAIAELIPPTDPKTSFNIGTIQGGTTVNSIPSECRAKLDIRSVSAEVLGEMDSRIKALVHQAVAAENARWRGDPVTVEFRRIGERPAGGMQPQDPIVQIFWKATEAVGLSPFYWPPLGSNANVPLSLGVPALGIGGGGTGGNLHSLDEWYCHGDSAKHAGRVLLAVFALAGLHGVTEPLAELARR